MTTINLGILNTGGDFTSIGQRQLNYSFKGRQEHERSTRVNQES